MSDEHAERAGSDVGAHDAEEAASAESRTVDRDVQFESWVHSELALSPLNQQGFQRLLQRSAAAICSIRSRLLGAGEKQVWNRLAKGDRLLKEVNEVVPVVARLLEWLDRQPCSGSGSSPVTVVDLCSGVGYMSLLLSELLATDGDGRVCRFVLVDSAFPQLNATALKPTHINPAHLRLQGLWGVRGSTDSTDSTCANQTELTYRNYNVQSSDGHRQLAKHVLAVGRR